MCVEGHERAIRQKTETMIDHFRMQVIARRRIGGQARAMVVTGGIQKAIRYFHAFRGYLKETKSQYKAIVAFYGGARVWRTEGHGGVAQRDFRAARSRR
jgi:type I restriction enzyme, R subunit